MDVSDQVCGTCRWFLDTWEDGEYGQCRRYPPEVPCVKCVGDGMFGLVWDHGVAMTEHPVVLTDGCCGEWAEGWDA